MDSDQDAQLKVQGNLDRLQRVTGTPFKNLELLGEAMRSAHRDENTHHDGNRELAAVGKFAVEGCIRFAKDCGDAQLRISAKIDYPKFLERKVLRDIAHNSSIEECIAHSPRQTLPLPEKVVANAVRALLGAVFVHADRDSHTVCRVLDALAGFISPNLQDRFWYSPVCAAFPVPGHFDVEVPGSFPSGGSAQVMSAGTEALEPGCSSQAALRQTLPNDGQSLVRSSSPGRLSSPVSHMQAKSAHSKLTRPHGDIEAYVESQVQLGKIYENEHTLRSILGSYERLPSLAMDTTRFTTIRKLCHGPISSLAVTTIKGAFERQSSFERCVPSNLSRPTYHYQELMRLRSTQFLTAIEVTYHIYHFYATTITESQMQQNEGFVHSSAESFSLNRKRPGNPRRRQISDTDDQMVRSLELEFDMKSRDEQRRLRGEVSRLRQLGQKISYFVDRFGLGILLLLPVSNDALGQRHCLSIPLGEIKDLTQRELKVAVNAMSSKNHPVKSFSKAAEPVLECLMNRGTQRSCFYQFEITPRADIESKFEGSYQLLQQLRPA